LSLDRWAPLQQDDSLEHHQERQVHGMAMKLGAFSLDQECFGIRGGMRPTLF